MKGQVNFIIFSSIIALIIFIPTIMFYGTGAESQVRKQVDDVKPFMRANSLKSGLEEFYIVPSYREAAKRALYTGSETVFERSSNDRKGMDTYIEAVREKAKKIADMRINGLGARAGCDVEGDADVRAEVFNVSEWRDGRFLTAIGISNPEPLLISCEGESASFERKFSISRNLSVNARPGLLDRVARRAMENKSLFQKIRNPGSEEDLEEKMEEVENYVVNSEYYGRSPERVETEIGSSGSGELWINVTDLKYGFYTEEGYENMEWDVLYSYGS